MKYFENMPLIRYPIKFNDEKTSLFKQDLIEFATTIDLNVRYSLHELVINNPFATYDYVWQDGDRPDNIARFYYGDAYYDWLVLLSAQIFDYYHELPLSIDQLVEFINKKYNTTFEESLNLLHHYEDGDGFWIDYDSYYIEPEPKKIVCVYDYEYEQNELKRNIKLISVDYLTQINNEFGDILKAINNQRIISQIVNT